MSPSIVCGVLILASVHPWKAHGDVSNVCLAVPLQGLFGAWVMPPPPLCGSLHTPCTEFWETQKRAGCAFLHHYTLLTFYSKRAQSRGLRAFTWGGRPFSPLREDKNHMGWGLSAGVPHLGACVDSG